MLSRHKGCTIEHIPAVGAAILDQVLMRITAVPVSCDVCSTPEGQEWRHGDLALIQSCEMKGKKFCAVGELTSEKAGQDVWLRGRMHASRSV